MFKSQILVLLILLFTLPCSAYPEAMTGRSGALDSGDSSSVFTQYQQEVRPSLETYREDRPRNSLTETSSPSKALTDFQQRNPKKEAFELYHRVEDTYETEPRFSY